MQKQLFHVDINAPREKVWSTLWDDATYRQWTKVFAEGSMAETDWQEGSKVLFTDGSGSGMYSEIAKRVDNEEMSIRHLGEIKNGEEQPKSDWAGAMEVYRLNGNGERTHLTVEIDMAEEHAEFFNEIFPKALQEVKRLSEQ